MQHDYRPGLATLELIVEVRRLLATERRTECLICRYLADLADRVREGLDNNLWGYADELHAARCIFGLGVRDTRERVGVGRALRELPGVEAAFVSGEVAYSRVRELTRVAEPSTEAEWLERARTLDMRTLERRVAAARDGAAGQASKTTQQANPRMDKPARTEWLTQNTVRVTFELSAEAWGLLERALEGARRCGDTKSAGDTGPKTIGAAATSAATTSAATMSDATMSDADALAEPASAAALCCGRSEIHLATEVRAVKRGGPLPAALRRAVMLRDRCRCRVPGCNRRRYVDVHHIIPRSSGGEHSRSNCLLLCTTHHHLLHDGKLELSGDAEGELCFRQAEGHSLVGPDDPALAIVIHDSTTPQSGSSSHGAAARLLRAIGRRGGWSLDASNRCSTPSRAGGNVMRAGLTTYETAAHLGALRAQRAPDHSPARSLAEVVLATHQARAGSYGPDDARAAPRARRCRGAQGRVVAAMASCSERDVDG